MLCGLCGIVDQPTVAQVGTRGLPAGPAGDLTTEIENAAADSVYAVELTFPRRLSVGEIRAIATELAIPRVLAYVEYTPRSILVLSLGRMYSSEVPRRHSECHALLGLKVTANALAEVPIDEWPTNRINAYATAHTIRELLSGKRLPAAMIVQGYAQKPEHLRILEQQIPVETSQPIAKPDSIDLPPYCSQFVAPVDAPTLSRDFPRGFQPPAAVQGESFRDAAFRLLGQLPPNTAVTIDLKLSIRANIELLASLVQEYDIRGMTAELVPERSSKRVIAQAELSARGGDLAAQVHRARCHMRIGDEEPQASSEWYADWVSVSLSTESAVRFLSYPDLRQAQVTGAHPIGALERLEGYFERLAGRAYEMPRSMAIPADCANVYVHGNYDEAGTVRAVPFTR
jgi:hypothetical protein